MPKLPGVEFVDDDSPVENPEDYHECDECGGLDFFLGEIALAKDLSSMTFRSTCATCGASKEIIRYAEGTKIH